MSYVTNYILIGHDISRQIRAINNLIILDGGRLTKGFRSIVGAAGGNHYMEVEILAAAFNYGPDIDEFVNTLKAMNWGEFADATLLVMDEGDEEFKIIHITGDPMIEPKT